MLDIYRVYKFIIFSKEFLASLSLTDMDDEIRWHPLFMLDRVPDIKEGAIPQPPILQVQCSAKNA